MVDVTRPGTTGTLEDHGFIEDADAAAGIELTPAPAQAAPTGAGSPDDTGKADADGAEPSAVAADAPIGLQLDAQASEDGGPSDAELAQDLTQHKGDFSAAMVKKLKAAGYSDRAINAQRKAIVADIQRATHELLESIGGAQVWGEIQSWARTALTEAQRKAFSAQLQDGDKGVRQMAAAGIKALFEQKTGKTFQQVDGGGVMRRSSNPVPAIKDANHYHELTQHPLYADPTAEGAAYRANVDKRLEEWSLKYV